MVLKNKLRRDSTKLKSVHECLVLPLIQHDQVNTIEYLLLSFFQSVLSLRAEGNSKVASLKRRADGLCAYEDLDAQIKHNILLNLKSLEEDWKKVLQYAQELHRSVIVTFHALLNTVHHVMFIIIIDCFMSGKHTHTHYYSWTENVLLVN